MWTILGGHGFIGRHLQLRLAAESENVFAPRREELAHLKGKHLGKVVYCIGSTSGFRSNTGSTFEAHMSLLQWIIKRNTLDHILYLSTTRLYIGSLSSHEDASFVLRPGSIDDTYAISKISGESFLLNSEVDATIVRLSNVFSSGSPDFGSGNFLDSIMFDAAKHGRVSFRTNESYAKDYIRIEDVVESIIKLSRLRAKGVYNVATGINVSNGEIEQALKKQGVHVDYLSECEEAFFPTIDVKKISQLGIKPYAALLDEIPMIVECYRKKYADG